MVSGVNSAGIFGMNTYMVRIEADISPGKAKFDMVGLPDAAVSESRERVRAAMRNSGFSFPNAHITVNLAPADIRKEGPVYDLPIIVALLLASGQIRARLDDCAFFGEVSLSGEIRRTNGILPMVIEAQHHGIESVFVPYENSREASIAQGLDVYPVKTVRELALHLMSSKLIDKASSYETQALPSETLPDFKDVKGQHGAKRALEVAAAGGHNVLMIGPPGSGKSMLAKRLPSILPELTYQEALETTKIYSIAGALRSDSPLITTRQFRSPHHTISSAGLSGGGSVPRPGEISLSHNGVLFLDEFPEFSRQAMELLRQPLEDDRITISRSAGSATFPCSFMLVAAMNPCPCGFYGDSTRKCTCSKAMVEKYLGKVSGPMLDRIDIHILVPRVDYDQLASRAPGESSAEIKARVDKARAVQTARLEGTGISCNAKMTPELVRKYCELTDEASRLLQSAFERMGLSARAYDRIIKTSRTIADLDGSESITVSHVAEAVQYRSLDRRLLNL